MMFTGAAGTIFSWAVLITAYSALALGLFCIWNYIIFEVLVRHAMQGLRVYDRFLRFIWYHARHKRDLKKNRAKNGRSQSNYKNGTE